MGARRLPRRCSEQRVIMLTLVIVLSLAVAEAKLVDLDIYKDMLVDMHNSFRRKVPASDMKELVWDTKLADKAGYWSKWCSYERHNYKHHNKYGENLFIGKGNDPQRVLFDAVQDWYDEGDAYNYAPSQHRCGDTCQYTQLVWADTDRVGCAINRCGRLFNGYQTLKDVSLLVCFYSPRGNQQGELPYQTGIACQDCPGGTGCRDGLCTGDSYLESNIIPLGPPADLDDDDDPDPDEFLPQDPNWTENPAYRYAEARPVAVTNQRPYPADLRYRRARDPRRLRHEQEMRRQREERERRRQQEEHERRRREHQARLAQSRQDTSRQQYDRRRTPPRDEELRRQHEERERRRREHQARLAQSRQDTSRQQYDRRRTPPRDDERRRQQEEHERRRREHQARLAQSRQDTSRQQYDRRRTPPRDDERRRQQEEHERRRREHQARLAQSRQDTSRQQYDRRRAQPRDYVYRDPYDRRGGRPGESYTDRQYTYRDEYNRVCSCDCRRSASNPHPRSINPAPLRGHVTSGDTSQTEKYELISVHNLLRDEQKLTRIHWNAELEKWCNYIIRCGEEYPGPRNTHSNFGRMTLHEDVYAFVHAWASEGGHLSRKERHCRGANDNYNCNRHSILMKPEVRDFACSTTRCRTHRQIVCLYR